MSIPPTITMTMPAKPTQPAIDLSISIVHLRDDYIARGRWWFHRPVASTVNTLPQRRPAATAPIT
jgi:hypothetical protein